MAQTVATEPMARQVLTAQRVQQVQLVRQEQMALTVSMDPMAQQVQLVQRV